MIIILNQKKAIRLITSSSFDAHSSPLCDELRLLKLQDQIKLQTLYFMHQFENRQITNCLRCVHNCDDQSYLHIFLRSSNL